MAVYIKKRIKGSKKHGTDTKEQSEVESELQTKVQDERYRQINKIHF